MSSSKSHTYFMIAAILAAFLFAWLLPEWAKHTKVGGEVFLRCLMMVVVPLVMTSVMSGILGLGDVRKLGRPGGTAVLFYVTTTVLAVLTGVLMFNLIQPWSRGSFPSLDSLQSGSHAEQMAVVEETSQQKKGLGDIFENLLLMLFTKNLLQSMVNIELLPLIVFSLIFAGMLTTLGTRIKAVSDFVLASNDALLNFVMLLMKFAPVGIFVWSPPTLARLLPKDFCVHHQEPRFLHDGGPGRAVHSLHGDLAPVSLDTHKAKPLSIHGADERCPVDGVFHGQFFCDAPGDHGMC